jgi:hypothetical protein
MQTPLTLSRRLQSTPPLCQTYAICFNGGGNAEYQLNIGSAQLGGSTGTWTISATAYVGANVVGGGDQILHTRFYPGGEVSGGGWPTARDQWEQISTTVHVAQQPTHMYFYIGYPMGHTAGTVWVTMVQVTRPDGSTVIPDGFLPNGAHIGTYSAGDSYGSYTIVPTCSFSPSPPPPPDVLVYDSTLRTWSDASANCQSMGRNLVTIHSAAQNAAVLAEASGAYSMCAHAGIETVYAMCRLAMCMLTSCALLTRSSTLARWQLDWLTRLFRRGYVGVGRRCAAPIQQLEPGRAQFRERELRQHVGKWAVE